MTFTSASSYVCARRSASASASHQAGYRMCETDRIYATLTIAGRIVVRLDEAGYASLAYLYNRLRDLAGEVAGLARLSVRNMSRGWTMQRPMLLKPAKKEAAPVPTQPMPWQVH